MSFRKIQTTKMFEGYNGTEWLRLVPSTYEETP
jgi:hypothetical protein